MAAEKGIDTSKWQASKVDYVKAKAAGYTYVFLRVGCGTTKDACFEKDYAAAIAAGLKVGVYFYTYSTTEEQAVQDASRVLGWLNGRPLQFPVAYDVEDAKQRGTNRRNINSAMFNSFANAIRPYYKPMLYSGESFFNNYFDKNKIFDLLWIAKYSTKTPDVGKVIHIWQYTSGAIATDFYTNKLDRNFIMTPFSDTADISEASNPYPEPTRTIKKTVPCMRGNDVKWIQFALGMPSKKIDGIYGNETKSAVMVYQLSHGLKTDGIVGPATRFSLKK